MRIRHKTKELEGHMIMSLDNFDSYPPFFLRSSTVDHGHPILPNPLLPDEPAQSDSLPAIDYQKASPEKLGQACREWGMFRLINHGIQTKLLNQILACANQVFSLSFESKLSCFAAPNPMLYFWGSPALTLSKTHENGHQAEAGKATQNLNWLEGFNVPLNEISQFRFDDDPLLESFRALLEEYGRHQSKLAENIFKTMARDLDLSPTKFDSYLSPPTGILRVYRYLRCPMADARWGIPEHTDSSVLSIVHQDEVGGLEVCKGNKWKDVKPVEATLIVNLGDMMQVMSDDEYVSVKHRVKVSKEKERISIGYFVFPAQDCVIQSTKYKPFTYADFHVQKELDLKTLGTKIGISKFRITQ